MKRLLVVLALLAAPVLAQPTIRILPSAAVGDLQTCNAGTAHRMVSVSDGSSATDCTVGGGSDIHPCFCDGSSWTVSFGAGAGGGEANQDAWSIMAPPAGTNPVADSATDTLTWTVTGPLTLTGDSGTDTMAFGWSGTLPDAQVAESNVTQHEAALSVTESQVSDLSHTSNTNAATICAGTDYYLDGEGNCDQITGGGGSSTLADLTDTTVSTPASGHVLLYDGSDSWDNKAMSGDVAITNLGATTIQSDSVALSTDTTGNYISSATASQGLLVTGTEGASVGIQDCAANEIMKRNAGDTDWECAADSTGGTPAFSDINSGTNTSAEMVVGSGAEIELAEGGEIEANEVIIFAQNETGATIYKCSAVHIHEFDIPSALPEMVVADADAAANMPAIGILYEDIADGSSGRVLLGGMLLGADTTVTEAWAEGDSVYVNDSGTSTSVDCGETLTNVRPANTDDAVQKIGTVVRAHGTAGKLVVSGAGRSNDVPNLEDDKFWLGNGSNVATAVAMSGDVLMANTGATTIQADSVALGTDTTGNYAGSGSEGGAATTATALAANGGNCAAGEIPLGVDASGAVEGCYEPAEADISDLAHTATAITDGLIVEADLDEDSGTPTDEDVLTYDTTGANFNWVAQSTLAAGTAAALAANGANCAAGEIPLGVDDAGAVEGCYEPAEADISDLDHTATGITDGLIVEADLDEDSGTPTDEDILTYDSTGANFNWIAQSGVAAGTAAALAANGANCSAGSYPLGVDADGAAETCTDASTEIDSIVATHTSDVDAHHTNVETKSAFMADPLDTYDDEIQFAFATAVTIAKVWCSTDTGTATIQFEERAEATPDTAGVDVLSTGLVCDATSQSSCASGCDVNTITNAGIDAYDPMSLNIEAVASTPTKLRIHVEYTK